MAVHFIFRGYFESRQIAPLARLRRRASFSRSLRNRESALRRKVEKAALVRFASKFPRVEFETTNVYGNAGERARASLAPSRVSLFFRGSEDGFGSD